MIILCSMKLVNSAVCYDTGSPKAWCSQYCTHQRSVCTSSWVSAEIDDFLVVLLTQKAMSRTASVPATLGHW